MIMIIFHSVSYHFRLCITERYSRIDPTRYASINRDKNGRIGAQKVFKPYIETGERPEKYNRVRKRANKI